MSKIPNDFSIVFGETVDGTFVAASLSSPYFCFEADNEADLEGIVSRALTFFERHQNARVPDSRAVVSSSRLRTQRIVSSRELLASVA